jgi:hypothetical protein
MERKGMLFLALLLLVSLVVAAALFSGGGGDDGVAGGPRPPGVASDAPFVDGLLTEVRTDRLTIKPDDGGEPVEMTIPPERARLLDLPHLVNFHQARNEPVRLFYEEEGEVRRAVGAVDLPGGPSGPTATGPSS